MSANATMDETVENPNIVLITCHDLGQHLGCYGVDTVDTPNIDSLAESGVQFENAYATSPVCSPARGSLLTGRYPQSNGLMGLTHGPFWWSIDDGEIFLPEMLREAGYETHLAGLQHVVNDPQRMGVDNFHNPEQEAADTVAAAREIFQNSTDRPFYAQLGFGEVHRTFDNGAYTEDGVFVPPYLEDTEAIREDFAAFQAEINYLDERVGEILGALEDTGHREDTIVVFAADHGIPHPGSKWTCRLPGLEIALLMDGPGSLFQNDEPASSVISGVDLTPTLLELCGVSVPERIEGVSFRNYLAGEGDAPREAAFAQYTEDLKRDNESRAVVTGDHHLIRYFDLGREVDYPVAVDPQRFTSHVERMDTSGNRPFKQLFDMQNDPYELEDLGNQNEYADVVKDLSRRLLGWMTSVDDPLLQGRVRTPYYRKAVDDLFSTTARED